MIIDRDESNRVRFNDLEGGDVFENIGRIFLKLAVPTSDHGFNSVDLESGTLVICDSNPYVVPHPDAELTGV